VTAISGHRPNTDTASVGSPTIDSVRRAASPGSTVGIFRSRQTGPDPKDLHKGKWPALRAGHVLWQKRDFRMSRRSTGNRVIRGGLINAAQRRDAWLPEMRKVELRRRAGITDSANDFPG
jgi:hypothetical protein